MTIRMSGINSGLDTDSIVKQLVSAYSTTKDNLVKAQTKLSWKQDSWKTMNTNIYSFYTNKLSNMRLSASYGLKKATISNSSYATVTASAGAVSSTQTLKVIDTAASGYLTGGTLSAADSTKTLSGTSKLTAISGLSSLTSGSIDVTANDKTTSISLTSDMTINGFLSALKDAGVTASFDTTNQRMFVSAKTSGADNDFTMTATDTAGLTALQNLGLYTSNAADNDEYVKWASYTDDEIATLKTTTYDSAKTTAAVVAKEYATAYNAAYAKVTAITSGGTTEASLNTSITDVKAAIHTAFSDYATDDGSGNYTYDTAAIKAAGRTTEYETLQKSLSGYQTSLSTLQSNQAIMDADEAYVTVGESGTATADATNTQVVSETATRNATIKTSVEAAIDKKRAYAKTMTTTAGDGTVTANTIAATGASATAVRTIGADSAIELNGAKFTSNTNSYSINGLTISATARTGSEAVTITTSTDVDGIYDMVKDFFTSYNTLIKSMDEAYNATSAKGYEPLTNDEKDAMSDTEVDRWEAKIKAALLRKDGTLGAVSSSLKSDMLSSFSIDGTSYSLSSFGIATLGYFSSGDNEKGVYHIAGNSDDTSTSGNTDKLRSAIAGNPEAVVGFLTQLSTKVYTDLTNKMASSSISSAYTIYNDKQMSTEYSEYKTKISDWEDKISDMEDSYYRKFTAMETALAALNSKSSSLSSLLG